MAFKELLIRTTKDIFESSIEGFVFNISAAIIILLIGFLIGKLLGRTITKILKRSGASAGLRKIGIRRSLDGVIGSSVSYVIYVASIILALDQLKIATIVLYSIMIIIIIVVVFSFLLSVKDFLPNLFAGLFIYRHGLIKEGDLIQVQEITGTVSQVSLLETRLETKEKDIVFIPNTVLTKNKVIKIAKKQ